MKISKKSAVTASNKYARRRYIKAADEDMDRGFDDFDDADGLLDAVDDVAENVSDLREAIDDVDDDDVQIAINNNIADHYIAECDNCNGIFISAVVDSDQDIEYVSGVCPLCGKETDQYLKWIIKEVKETE